LSATPLSFLPQAQAFTDPARSGTFAQSPGSNYLGHSDWQEQAMNWDRVEGNWKEFKGKVQQKWGKLTNDDLDVIEGKRTELAGRLQQRYGVAKDDAERQIDTWLNGVN
jgi:uncharacterized protein YjbJ (UPF0337 family)